MIRSSEILLYLSVPIYEFILVLEIIFLIKYWDKKLLYFFIFCKLLSILIICSKFYLPLYRILLKFKIDFKEWIYFICLIFILFLINCKKLKKDISKIPLFFFFISFIILLLILL